MLNAAIELFRGLTATFRDPRVRSLTLFAFTLVAIASVFYKYVEGWSWIDALYFSVMTISTVGYGDITPHTNIGKLFSIAYVVCGLGVFVAAATAIADSLLSQRSDND